LLSMSLPGFRDSSCFICERFCLVCFVSCPPSILSLALTQPVRRGNGLSRFPEVVLCRFFHRSCRKRVFLALPFPHHLFCDWSGASFFGPNDGRLGFLILNKLFLGSFPLFLLRPLSLSPFRDFSFFMVRPLSCHCGSCPALTFLFCLFSIPFAFSGTVFLPWSGFYSPPLFFSPFRRFVSARFVFFPSTGVYYYWDQGFSTSFTSLSSEAAVYGRKFSPSALGRGGISRCPSRLAVVFSLRF